MVRKAGGYDINIKSGVDHDLWISLARIDPKVAVSWGEPAMVGKTPVPYRMSTVEQQRRNGIMEALKIWKPKIIEVFGNDFYRHFCHSYEAYLDLTFLIRGFKKRSFSSAFLRARNPDLIKLIAGKSISRITGSPQCNLFPSYKQR